MDDLDKRLVYVEIKLKQLDETDKTILEKLDNVLLAQAENTRLLSTWKGGLAVLGLVGSAVALFINWGFDWFK